ncbi:hypothetical protein QR680_011674 [Steinernema hermaphroditum]|uniref:Uncharacterized protein n=1 Tax=Steinernema hermaphroditum TaxID=289476 RepID=A0AA39I1L8_9BILA|nr:hypothetical protein QR680_011674 [Steinernema hermaphroditum]
MSTTSLSQNIFKISHPISKLYRTFAETSCKSDEQAGLKERYTFFRNTTNGSATIRIRYLIHTSSYGQQAAPYIENFLENPDFVKFPDAISRSTRKLECFEGRKMDDDDALKDVCHSWCIYSKCGAVHGVQHNPSHHKGAATKLCIRPFYESIWDTVETGFDPRSADFRRARSSDRQLKLLTKKL